MEEAIHIISLPLDVVQIVLGYVQDAKSMAAARRACKAWRQASSAAPATLSVLLPGAIPDMRNKLALVLQVMPGLASCHASVCSAADADYPAECFRQLLSFPNLRALQLRFPDSQELGPADVTQLACLTALTALQLSNVSLPASTDISPLTLLRELRELALVHHSKVSALMVGDAHLLALASLGGLTQLVLQGRMCSTTDDGLLALAGLTDLHSLAISWVPWQSQISQRAALQLLSGLKQLRSLQLGGAELLLPSTPYYAVAAHAPGPPAVPGAAAPAVHAPAPEAPASRVQHGLAGADSSSGAAESMRDALVAKADTLDVFKLQFNCCGTGVEKALLSLGDARARVTGLQWSYAKLAGPTSAPLLGSCTSLRSLKLRLWYQDYNLAPFELDLLALAPLVHLRTLVIDKRPPFQQQLPAQQAAISIPITSRVVRALAGAWPLLAKLQLGLARSDFGPRPLEGLAGFRGLKSLSVHCYDQGFDDGHFMLPIDVACLPSSLVKLDLLHAELLCSSSSREPSLAKRERSGSGSSCGRDPMSSSSSLRSCSSVASAGSGSGSCSKAASGAGSCSDGSAGAAGRVGCTASAFSSMLSESFSLLSRQASSDCSSAYLDQLLEQQQAALAARAGAGSPPPDMNAVSNRLQVFTPCPAGGAPGGGDSISGGGGGSGTGGGSSSCAGSAGSAGSSSGSSLGARLAGAPLSETASADQAGGWLQDLLNDQAAGGSDAAGGDRDAPPRAAAQRATAAAASEGKAGSSNGSSSSQLPRATSLPPLSARKSHATARSPAGHSVRFNLPSPPAAVAAGAVLQPAPPAPQPDAGAAMRSAVVGAPAARRQNPFAAAAAAAAVHAAVGGCLAAVDPATGGVTAAFSSAAGSAAAASSGSSSGELSWTAAQAGASATAGLVRSCSVAHGGSSKGAAGTSGARASSSAGDGPLLPMLQHLQLKHCMLAEGACLDDIISRPIELRSLQLVEVCGLTPRGIALLPFLANLSRLTLIAAKEDAWLGLAPLRLLAKLPELRHLDWVVSERALSGRTASRTAHLAALRSFPRLQVLTLHTQLGKYESLHAVSGQLKQGCLVRLMSPAYCEHASRKTGSCIGRLLGAASCLIPGSSQALR